MSSPANNNASNLGKRNSGIVQNMSAQTTGDESFLTKLNAYVHGVRRCARNLGYTSNAAPDKVKLALAIVEECVSQILNTVLREKDKAAQKQHALLKDFISHKLEMLKLHRDYESLFLKHKKLLLEHGKLQSENMKQMHEHLDTLRRCNAKMDPAIDDFYASLEKLKTLGQGNPNLEPTIDDFNTCLDKLLSCNFYCDCKYHHFSFVHAYDIASRYEF